VENDEKRTLSMLKNNYLSLCNDATQKLMILFYDSCIKKEKTKLHLKSQYELCKDWKNIVFQGFEVILWCWRLINL